MTHRLLSTQYLLEFDWCFFISSPNLCISSIAELIYIKIFDNSGSLALFDDDPNKHGFPNLCFHHYNLQ